MHKYRFSSTYFRMNLIILYLANIQNISYFFKSSYLFLMFYKYDKYLTSHETFVNVMKKVLGSPNLI